MPPTASVMFSDFRRLLARGPYAQVFGALGAEGALSVAPPDNGVLSSRGVARGRDSMVKIEGTAPGCSRRIEGSGFVFARHHVITNAHVVAGVSGGPVVTNRHSARFASQVVLFDPERDIAVLYVPRLAAAAGCPGLRAGRAVRDGRAGLSAASIAGLLRLAEPDAHPVRRNRAEPGPLDQVRQPAGRPGDARRVDAVRRARRVPADPVRPAAQQRD